MASKLPRPQGQLDWYGAAGGTYQVASIQMDALSIAFDASYGWSNCPVVVISTARGLSGWADSLGTVEDASTARGLRRWADSLGTVVGVRTARGLMQIWRLPWVHWRYFQG